VVTFKPGKEMEERVRQLTNVPSFTEDEEDLVAEASNGQGQRADGAAAPKAKARAGRARKTS
jgi:hypothetical protein